MRLKSSNSGNIRIFQSWRQKVLFFEKNFLSLTAIKFHFVKYKKFLQAVFFFFQFFVLVFKSSPGSPMYYYYYYSSWSLNRSSHWRFSVKKVFLKISQILQKTPVSESLFKTRIHYLCLPVKFGKFLRTSIFRNICKRLILVKVGLTFLNFNLSKVL